MYCFPYPYYFDLIINTASNTGIVSLQTYITINDMDTSTLLRSLSLGGSEDDTNLSPAMSEENTFNNQSDQACTSTSKRRYKRSDSSTSGSYVVEYGPVRIRHRRTLSQTLATGRRSKDDPIEGDEAIKRELRRAKNRIAARDLKRARDQVELNLVQQLKELEEQEEKLETQHKQLEERKAQLNRAVYNARQAPLVSLITDIDIPIYFKPQDQPNLLFDLQLLLENIDDQYSKLNH
ncbi:unnamed protein product [Adineta steineri]|uniref:BZIP domain-containing protein n=1 Tax=Adineta steineri TaxID=433720 RepID=A0A814CXI9_9BILA|nr:unnamed protein product [Adineta steineri]